jgi:hypothetical protein
MIGLLFLGEVVLWLVVLKWGVTKIGSHLPARPWRPIVMLGIFLLMLPLPLLDEIIGGWQFKRLCEANVVHVNKDTARGKTVYVPDFPRRTLTGTWIPVYALSRHFLDVTTGETVISYEQFFAEGGRLFPGFDSGHDPLTFKSECVPDEVKQPHEFLKNLNITWVSKPTEQIGVTK